MSAKRTLLLDFLYDLTVYTILLSAVGVITFTFSTNDERIYLQLCILPFMLFFFIRKTIRHHFLLIPLHFIPIALFFVFPTFNLKLAFVIFYVISFFYSLTKKLKPGNFQYSFAFFVTSLAVQGLLLILNDLLSFQLQTTQYFVFSLLSVACYVLYTHIANIDFAISFFNEQQPKKSILRFNNNMIAIYTACILLVAFFSLFARFESFLAMLGSGLLWVIRLIGGLFHSDEEPYVPAEPTIEEAVVDRGDSLLVGKTNPVLAIIGEIFLYIGYLSVICLFLAVIGYFAYRLYKQFASLKNESSIDQKEFVKPVFSSRSFLRILTRRHNYTGTSPIRRQFYEKVRKYITAGVAIAPSDTANDMAQKIKPFENIDKLVTDYEQARYKNEGGS